MAPPNIFFFNEESSYIIKGKTLIRRVLASICFDENKTIDALNIIICSDNYLYNLNKTYLNHNTLTDVITFNYSETKGKIQGDVFLSEDRAKENAKSLRIRRDEEINRLIIHGLLHLCGYKDKTEKEKLNMRRIEDKYLSLLSKLDSKNRKTTK
ncbi:MAG: rRNA maturation RNase YbeY [Saprospiraceae bacterium]|nr:rRNA maturation RNase YbeY [Saprospiraceae bacterium]